jgi:hypothetical protein
MKGFHINGDERQLLWALLRHDTIDAVHAIVASVNSHGDKTVKIINQMDFVFQLRMAIANTPASGGGIWLDIMPQKYLTSMLHEAKAAILSLEDRALFYRFRDGLLLKLGDQERGWPSVVQASEPEKPS